MARTISLLKGTASSLITLLVLSGCASNANPADPSSFPTKDLEVIVPFSAGGGSDAYARQIATKMGEELGVDVAVQNVPGAASLLGLRQAMSAEPDGHTLTTFNPPSSPLSQVMAGEQAGVDLGEASIIGGFGANAFTVFTHPNSGINSYEELVEMYAAGEVDSIAGAARGGVDEAIAHMLKLNSELNWGTYIAYEAGPEVLASVIREEAPVGITSDTAIAQSVTTGTAVPLAVIPEEGSPLLPDVPTLADMGYDGIEPLGANTRVIAAPPGLPDEIQTALTEALEAAVNHEDTQEWAETTGNPVEFLDEESASEIVQNSLEMLQEEYTTLEPLMGS